MMRPIVLLALPWLVAACASSGGAPASREPSGPIEGTYDYVANIPGQQIQGKLLVLGDTMMVRPASDYCQPVTGSPDPMAIHYTCSGPGRFEQLRLRIDRRNPAQFSKWSATFRVQKRRTVCVQTAIQSGREVCVRTGTETYEDTESSSGSLQVRRAP